MLAARELLSIDKQRTVTQNVGLQNVHQYKTSDRRPGPCSLGALSRIRLCSGHREHRRWLGGWSPPQACCYQPPVACWQDYMQWALPCFCTRCCLHLQHARQQSKAEARLNYHVHQALEICATMPATEQGAAWIWLISPAVQVCMLCT